MPRQGGHMSALVRQIISTRSGLWLGFYAVVLLAWWAMFEMARGGSGIGGSEHIRMLPHGGFWALMPMWAVMIAAMMLPTIVPMLRTYSDLPASSGANTSGWIGIVAGYALVWLLAAAGFAGVQVVALNNGVIEMTGVLASPWASAALLAVAGVWQFSRTKTTCQNVCLTPMQSFMARWQPGLNGGIRIGVGAGVACVGCCWAIMSLAFVGGVMNLLWMGLATLFMVAEKLPEIGMALRRPAGVSLLGAAVATAIGSGAGIF